MSTIQVGLKIGSYEIVSLLGKGGMGEVYRARHLKLKREVAIKTLPDEFSRDPERKCVLAGLLQGRPLFTSGNRILLMVFMATMV
jgi:serine/threonine protein kinase